jgi:hypothetical protein
VKYVVGKQPRDTDQPTRVWLEKHGEQVTMFASRGGLKAAGLCVEKRGHIKTW